MRSFTPLMTAIVFAPDCLRMPSETDGTPSSDAADVGSTPLSSTRPMSLTLTGKPFFVVMTMSLNSSTSVTR